MEALHLDATYWFATWDGQHSLQGKMIAFEQHLLLVMRDIIQVLPSTEQQQLERPLQDLETFGALTSDAEVLSTQLDASMELGDILQTLTSTLRRIGSVVNTLLHGQSSLESVPM